ncbi:importin alpha re-exporter [Vararia minispora EC-137]|uniref:Importin alpha re-exporter n=1 Tax=Vararia minispora EC-137 TaxID=1314806 RepID=A0ACB8QBY8_9AGAM|nr:importin alpha re-exporter [Vararia minispora EC-137]
MSDVPTLLLSSLRPQTRKHAEAALASYASHHGFLPSLLALALAPAQDRPVRLAAAVYLKNAVKAHWPEDDDAPVPESDRAALRPQLVPAMVALLAPADRALRAQIAETVALIAAEDFPERWPDLIDHLVASLSPSNFTANAAVLETAHAIFAPWRSATRSDALYRTINRVLSAFLDPFCALFSHTLSTLLSPASEPSTDAAACMLLLTELFYDLTCHDLPPRLEDGHEEFFAQDTGGFMRLMAWDPPTLRTDVSTALNRRDATDVTQPDDTTPSIPTRIRTVILEIAEMYIKLYPEMLARTHSVEAFVRAVWELVGGGTQRGVAYDPLITQSLRFISTAIRAGPYRDLFAAHDTVASLVAGVVLPNIALREHDVEQFEDAPLEFVRSDLAISEIATPRQAAADVIKALVDASPDATPVLESHVAAALSSYAASPTDWRKKDAAVFLFEAAAARGANPALDVVAFFANAVVGDLSGPVAGTHPVLRMDAVRYLHVFRNQLTKDQLVSVLPLLKAHLADDNVVVHTYAAVAIDRILALRVGSGGPPMFTPDDVRAVAPELIDVLLRKIEAGSTPEKVAENDLVMRCVTRVVITARSHLAPGAEALLGRLVNILGIISKNPSNPNFDQYIFESISALIRFVGPAKPGAIGEFESTLFGPFTYIIQNDIDQYIPYTFQILAQMLAQHDGVPTDYRSLVPLLLTPASWTQKGSIPGLVKLLQAFLARDARQIVESKQLESVLGIVQQRLIPSKINDAWGFELLQAVVRYVPPPDLQPYFRGIIMTLLTRMQSSKTDSYVYHFVCFLSYVMAIPVEGLTPDYVIQAVDGIQPGLWSQLLTNFVVPQASKLAAKDRKVAAVGLTRMLTQSQAMLQPPSVAAWPQAFTALVQLFREPQALQRSTDDDADTGVTAIDVEEQTAGYQAAYSRLAAADAAPQDPTAHVPDVQAFAGQQLQSLVQSRPAAAQMIAGADQTVVAPFVAALRGAGFQV